MLTRLFIVQIKSMLTNHHTIGQLDTLLKLRTSNFVFLNTCICTLLDTITHRFLYSGLPSFISSSSFVSNKCSNSVRLACFGGCGLLMGVAPPLGGAKPEETSRRGVCTVRSSLSLELLLAPPLL